MGCGNGGRADTRGDRRRGFSGHTLAPGAAAHTCSTAANRRVTPNGNAVQPGRLARCAPPGPRYDASPRGVRRPHLSAGWGRGHGGTYRDLRLEPPKTTSHTGRRPGATGTESPSGTGEAGGAPPTRQRVPGQCEALAVRAALRETLVCVLAAGRRPRVSVFIFKKSEVFIVCGYRVVMLSVMKYKIFASLPDRKSTRLNSSH